MKTITTLEEIATDLANVHYCSEFGHLEPDWNTATLESIVAENGGCAAELAEMATDAWRKLVAD